MNKIYKVLKDFPMNNTMRRAGDKIEDNILGEYISAQLLIEEGYIEEIKENSRWRADENEGQYWYVDYSGEIEWGRGKDFDYEYGNHFKSKETAQKVADALKVFFELLHDNDTELKDYKNLDKVFDIAKKAVLEDDKENTQ